MYLVNKMISKLCILVIKNIRVLVIKNIRVLNFYEKVS